MARFLFALALLCWLDGARLEAQQLTLPHLDWQTVRTQHFEIHYPAAAAEWTLDMATRIESVHDAVSRLVGSAPNARVTVIVEDPGNESNGFAIPLIREPVIFFWPTPPGPRTGIADSRGWAEILSVHEYAHIAHLTRPTRNPFRHFLTRISPVSLGPVALKSPRWVSEGYATWVEGRLTGSGRPHGAWRAAVLRQWALEGKLPTYSQLSSDQRFYGGEMAYLVGSAYLDWLVARSGDSSLVHLWRRMSARENRTFDDSFAGVFGGYPADLYGRFAAELTGKALEVERDIDSAIVAAGDSGAGRTVQALTWNTGPPAVSLDGKLLALVVRARDRPSRVVVWKTAEEQVDSSALRAGERILRLDPEDVPAIQWRPRPKEAVAVLYPDGGAAYDEPRFLPDSDRILLLRATGRGDGATRPDLFIWNFRTGVVQRVTRNAALRHADPAPDGTHAVGDRCVEGICDLVRVDLRNGALEVIARGSPRLVYYRPRFSSDGRTIAVSVQQSGRWRVALLDAKQGDGDSAPRFVDPDDGANRYDPSFMPGDSTLAVTSDATGIPNVEIVNTRNGMTRTLTLTTGAALAPDVDRVNGSVYFLRLHAKGLDLNVVADSTIRANAGLALASAPALEPATRVPPVRADTFAASPQPEPHPYGIGPRTQRILPSLSWTAEGKTLGIAMTGTDPVGRLTWVAQGIYGDRGSWRGGSLGAAWRGARPLIGASIFYSEDHASRQHGGFAAPAALDLDYLGSLAQVELGRDNLTNVHRFRAGVSVGRLGSAGGDRVTRSLGFAEYSGAVLFTPGELTVAPRLRLLGSLGRTASSSWARAIVSAGAEVTYGRLGARADASYGVVSSDAAVPELFALGGTAPPLFDPALLAQRVVMPALPAGLAVGDQFSSYRIALPGAGIQPYFWSASVGNDLRDWHHVVGLEWTYDFEGLWPVGLPGTLLSCGVGYSLSEPLRHKLHGYLTLSYRP